MNEITRGRVSAVATAVLISAAGLTPTASTSAVAAESAMHERSGAAADVRTTVHQPLVRRLLTPKQFPGFKVAGAPQIQTSYITSLGCQLTAPKSSTTADTWLIASTKLSGTRTRTVRIAESATEFLDAASARTFYAKIRASVSSCDLVSQPDDDIDVSSRFVATVVAPGASHAFATLTTTSDTHINGKHRYVTHTAVRSGVYQAGRYIVEISADRTTVTTTPTFETEVSVDDVTSRNLNTQAAAAAIRLLTAS